MLGRNGFKCHTHSIILSFLQGDILRRSPTLSIPVPLPLEVTLVKATKLVDNHHHLSGPILKSDNNFSFVGVFFFINFYYHNDKTCTFDVTCSLNLTGRLLLLSY